MFIDLFPTVVFTQNLKLIFIKEINNFINFILNEKSSYTPKEGYTTFNQNILSSPIFNNLNKEILNYVKDYFKEIGYTKYNFKIICSWGNVLSNNEQIHTHFHKNSLISGSYYLTKNNSSIRFFNHLDNDWLFELGDKSNSSTYRSCNYWDLIPTQNMLVLFPSWLPHQVLPSNSQEDRISIAFNIVPKGEFGVPTGKFYI